MIYFPDVKVALDLYSAVFNPEVLFGNRTRPKEVTSPPDVPAKAIGILESALNSIQWHYSYGERRIPILGGLLAARIAKNHPFLDGNKRMGVAVMLLFLEENGYRLPEERQVDLLKPLNGVLEGRVSEEEFCELIAELVRRRPGRRPGGAPPSAEP